MAWPLQLGLLIQLHLAVLRHDLVKLGANLRQEHYYVLELGVAVMALAVALSVTAEQ